MVQTNCDVTFSKKNDFRCICHSVRNFMYDWLMFLCYKYHDCYYLIYFVEFKYSHLQKLFIFEHDPEKYYQ